MASPARAAIYARISHDATGEALGVERQLDDCRSLAVELGWTVAEEYVDNDRSAFSGKDRPEYSRLMDDVRAGARDGIVSWHADRLHRSPTELETFISVCEKAAVAVQTVRAGILDLGSPSGRTIARIHGALARGESEKMSERLKRANRQRAELGKPARKRGYGYDLDGTLRPDEAKIVQQLAERFLAGESIGGLNRWLNENNVPPPSGTGKWWATTVRDVLRSARISGQSEYHGQIVGKGQWTAIVTPDQTARIRHILDSPDRRTTRAPSRYLLTGILRCGICGGRIAGGPHTGVPSYLCRTLTHGCGRISIKAEPLEEYARDLALTALDGPDLARALTSVRTGDAAAGLTDQIASDERLLTELAETFVDGAITREQLTAGSRKLTRRIEAAREQLASASGNQDLLRYVGQGDELRRSWSAMNLDQRRAVVRAVFDTLTIKPATRSARYGFDSDRVGIAWRV